MKGFQRTGADLVAQLSQQEAAVIRGLVGQIKDMLDARAAESPQDELSRLTGIRTGPSTPPEDRIMARLLPDFHVENPEDGRDVHVEYGRDLDMVEPSSDLSAALRSLHEPDLVEAKGVAADSLLSSCPVDGGTVRLSPEQADAWLAAVNDVRLALGTALDVSEDMPEDLGDDDPRSPHLSVYHWLTWLQENLLQAMAS